MILWHLNPKLINLNFMNDPIFNTIDSSGFQEPKAEPKPPIQSGCANGCGRIIEGLVIGGTCCSKACADELREDMDSTHEDDLIQDKNWEHEQDYALEMADNPTEE